MSHAFMKDSEGEWLDEIPPTLSALIVYISKENNGIRVYEKSRHTNPDTGKEIHVMSNGLSYSIDEKGRWYMLD